MNVQEKTHLCHRSRFNALYELADDFWMALQVVHNFHTLFVVSVYPLSIETIHNSREVACTSSSLRFRVKATL